MNPSPGPWTYVGEQDGAPVRDASGVSVVHQDEDGWINFYGDDGKLIALAPEMRDMLLKLEWSAYDGSAGVGYCPNCKAVEPLELGGGDHDSHCALDVLLEKLR